jgi:hypothetical protein
MTTEAILKKQLAEAEAKIERLKKQLEEEKLPKQEKVYLVRHKGKRIRNTYGLNSVYENAIQKAIDYPDYSVYEINLTTTEIKLIFPSPEPSKLQTTEPISRIC